HREKRFAAQPQPGSARFSSLWADWELEAIYRFTPVVESDTFRMITRGKQIPAAAYRARDSGARVSVVSQLWNTGASINFARLELFSNPVLALVRNLEAEVHCPVRVHFFTTPAQSQALGLHFDHDDALVLQIGGEKAWSVYPDSNEWPVDPARTAALLRERQPTNLTLGPGGWLYLPKGIYHEVRNIGNAPCTHFTLGLHPLTWGLLLEQAIGQARRGVPSLRDTIAVGGTAGEAWNSHVESRLEAIRPFVTRALTAGHFGERLPATEYSSRRAIDIATASTYFRWRDDVAHLQISNQGVEINLAYRSVALTLNVEFASIVESMRKARVFSPAVLSGNPEVSLALCMFLANTGVLRVESDMDGR
ncbi:MAG TPA: cupin domain-containing protein, partial [Opitutaceae bacterium]|nr:cupin domain-containing protein [Opitutaceae bacterium]